MKIRNIDFILIVLACILLGMLAQPEQTLKPFIGYTVSLKVPAVDSENHGVIANLIVETKRGSSKTLANIDVLLFWVDTQQSIQTARAIAEDITGIDTTGIDLIYTIEADNTSLVGGPSAGAAFTIATVAALERRQPRKDVMITGTIEEDGTIGQVGEVLEKARAAKSAGAKIFLVPKGQSMDMRVVRVENCEKRQGYTYCETLYKKKKINISKELGIKVIEVSNIHDAMNYFFQ